MTDNLRKTIMRRTVNNMAKHLLGPSLQEIIEKHPAAFLASELPPWLGVRNEGAGVLKIVPVPPAVAAAAASSRKRRIADVLRRFFRCRLDIAYMALPAGYVSVETFTKDDPAVAKAIISGMVGTINNAMRYNDDIESVKLP